MTGNLSFGYVGLAFALAVGGGALGASLGSSHRRLCALISLGAGTLLGVTAFAIVPESAEKLRWWGVLLALGSGYALFAVITRYVYHVCPACAASHFDEATTHRFSEIATAMMVALAIHCMADGIALAAGHEAEASHTARRAGVGFFAGDGRLCAQGARGSGTGRAPAGGGFWPPRDSAARGGGGGDDTAWGCPRLAVPATGERLLAGCGGGARWRRFLVSCGARGAGRDPQTPQGSRRREFCRRIRGDRNVRPSCFDCFRRMSPAVPRQRLGGYGGISCANCGAVMRTRKTGCLRTEAGRALGAGASLA